MATAKNSRTTVKQVNVTIAAVINRRERDMPKPQFIEPKDWWHFEVPDSKTPAEVTKAHETCSGCGVPAKVAGALSETEGYCSYCAHNMNTQEALTDELMLAIEPCLEACTGRHDVDALQIERAFDNLLLRLFHSTDGNVVEAFLERRRAERKAAHEAFMRELNAREAQA
jgi:hypothetical protein